VIPPPKLSRLPSNGNFKETDTSRTPRVFCKCVISNRLEGDVGESKNLILCALPEEVASDVGQHSQEFSG
jgi:hypothetical protein